MTLMFAVRSFLDSQHIDERRIALAIEELLFGVHGLVRSERV